ncbi:ABC transporter substrate-binding protein [Lentibacillus sp. CBA3610]|uniref:ABC transporter substrate-binding protein n=1 Tax=Lentibacillus sp. CBA3610 TaxID=2518176 RepID=UPI0015961961|nr:ABC transporter substrate-binding protein [Lentibacillus sp. CBA3610]QKY69335.1 extracellular solute-binding protein [Lentibacillus sp. CBA3610]
MKKVLVAMFMLFMLILAACGTDASDENESATAEESSEETSSEGENAESDAEVTGELEFYTSQPDADAEQLVSAFNEAYPEVQVNIFRSGTEEVMSKINAEKQAGDVQADVLLVADEVTFEGLKEQEMLMSYSSPETDAIPDEFIDSDGTYTGTKIMSTGLVVNTENVDEMPSSWQVLTSDEAADQVVMPSPLYSGAAAYNLSVLTRNDAFGWEFYEDIKANNPMVTDGNGAVMENVASGQKTYGMVVDYLAARAANDGSPVELVYPDEGVPVITEPIGIMADTDQEKAAKAFVDFVLSEEGQKMQSEIGYTPIREGVEAPEGLKTFDEIDVLTAPIEELYQNREADKEEFDQLFSE